MWNTLTFVVAAATLTALIPLVFWKYPQILRTMMPGSPQMERDYSEKDIMRVLKRSGWQVASNRFSDVIASKDEVRVFLLCGPNYHNARHRPTPKPFESRVQIIRDYAKDRTPLIVVVVQDPATAAFFTAANFTTVSVLTSEQLHFIESLFPQSLSNAGDSRSDKWALDAVRRNPHLCYKQSVFESRLKHWNAALDWAERAVALDPHSGNAYSQLSVIQLAKQDLEKARASARRAVALTPTSAVFYRRLSNAELQCNNPKGALAAAEKAITLADKDGNSHHTLALVHLRSGRSREALAAEERAVELDPKNAAFQSRLTLIRAAANREQLRHKPR